MDRRRFLFSVAAASIVVAVTLGAFWGGPSRAQSEQGGEKEPPRKAQHVVAAKVEFATVAADSEAVAKALKADDLAGARNLIRKPGAFEGKVAEIFAPESNSVVILNFDSDYRNALSAVVYSAHFAKFPDLAKLKGKRVLVTGNFSEYKGRPQIELTNPSQIKIIK
jgi:Predicted RNA-binding protein, contains TRAM domain